MPSYGEYFLAIVPPPPLRDELARLKQEFSERYHSRAALHSPPHITLHRPFRKTPEEEGQLLQTLEALCLSLIIPPFQLAFRGYGCFRPRVIFIQVSENDSLNLLQERLGEFCKVSLQVDSVDEHPFHPHLTLAFRDLKRGAFRKAWAEVKDQAYSASFMVDRFALLKHNGKVWEVFSEYKLDRR